MENFLVTGTGIGKRWDKPLGHLHCLLKGAELGLNPAVVIVSGSGKFLNHSATYLAQGSRAGIEPGRRQRLRQTP